MLKNGLYNKQKFMPAVTFGDYEILPRYSHHAIEASADDRYGKIELPDSFNLSRMELVELEVVNNRPFKAVVRMHYDYRNDLVVVILLETFVVKSVWLNRKSDNHRTLRNPENYNSK